MTEMVGRSFWETQFEFNRRAELENQREQTAATILAALIGDGAGEHWFRDGKPEVDSNTQGKIEHAVVLADALRAELARKP